MLLNVTNREINCYGALVSFNPAGGFCCRIKFLFSSFSHSLLSQFSYRFFFFSLSKACSFHHQPGWLSGAVCTFVCTLVVCRGLGFLLPIYWLTGRGMVTNQQKKTGQGAKRTGNGLLGCALLSAFGRNGNKTETIAFAKGRLKINTHGQRHSRTRMYRPIRNQFNIHSVTYNGTGLPGCRV